MIGTLLLLLFIFFVVIPLGKILWRVWSITRTMREARRRMDDAMRGAYDDTTAGKRPGASPARKKKKIDPSVGEYVAFEEVSCDIGTASAADNTTRTVKVESQIEDAVWEEIK